MKKIALYLFIFLPVVNVLSQTTIQLERKNGAYIVPCKVNGVPMNFIFDTGATDVTISLTEAEFLFKQGLLKENDIKQSIKYQTASGELRKGTKINLREIEISGLTLHNVSTTIVHEQNAPLLLGMSALNQLGKIEIENGKLIINSFFKNEVDIENIEEETKKTIDWINNKLIKHQYENDGTRQVQSFKDVKEINGIYCLTGIRIQETTKPWGFSQAFIIPLLKINNVSFEEKQYNYWLTIKMKNAEEAIAITNDGENWNKKDVIDFILNKSIDDEDLRPLILSAIEHLVKLYSNKQVTTNQKVVKYEVEGGYVEHIGEMLKDGWIKNSYDEQNRLVAKQETYTDTNDKVKELKTKTTIYNPSTGIIKHIDTTPMMFKNQYIGEYKSYYDNGNLNAKGQFYDFFKNGYKAVSYTHLR
uniref:retropepsin-like aspartic protease family protein n=1 Tax=Flavobacterium sp. UBA6046 TaxID=1946552 RepID=UPI0025C61930